jgi:hypothetical protein
MVSSKSSRNSHQPRRSDPVAASMKSRPLVPKMLILRGIAGHFAGRDWPKGALGEPSALA